MCFSRGFLADRLPAALPGNGAACLVPEGLLWGRFRGVFGGAVTRYLSALLLLTSGAAGNGRGNAAVTR
ncbi:hypothetical protein Cco03nite_83240 [Catellatospora coxensis]|uniref:Uncharacterized protein n=1 Tax=Catellatospora coxensis TaxID=310354 RepID=A0A8J3L530_9ACTN|nr:hypothetical protein Cco03nite_83240 [Catellatospora coxensis]